MTQRSQKCSKMTAWRKWTREGVRRGVGWRERMKWGRGTKVRLDRSRGMEILITEALAKNQANRSLLVRWVNQTAWRKRNWSDSGPRVQRFWSWPHFFAPAHCFVPFKILVGPPVTNHLHGSQSQEAILWGTSNLLACCEDRWGRQTCCNSKADVLQQQASRVLHQQDNLLLLRHALVSIRYHAPRDLLLQMFVSRAYLDLKTKNQQILHTLIAETLDKIKPTDPLRLVMQVARRKRNWSDSSRISLARAGMQEQQGIKSCIRKKLIWFTKTISWKQK